MKNIRKITAFILCFVCLFSVAAFPASAAVAAPQKPQMFSATQVTAGTVTLDWLPSEGATGYRIYSYVDGNWKIIKDTTQTTVTISGLTASKTYIFAIKSAKKVLSKVYFCDGYSQIKVKTSALSSTQLSAVAGLEHIDLYWNRVLGASGYAVYQYMNGKWKCLGAAAHNKAACRIKNLKKATTYYFAIRPYANTDNGIYQAPASNIVKIRTLDPNKVTASCAAVTDSAMKITWTKAENATGYRIYAYLSGVWKPVKDIYSANTLSYVFSNLTSDTNYYIRVRAFRKSGSSVTWYEASDTCTVTTNPGVKDVYVHRVDELRSIMLESSYTLSYDNVTRLYGTVPVTVAKSGDKYYLSTKVNEMPYALLNDSDGTSYILLEENECYIKVPSLLNSSFDVKTTMDEFFPGEDWTAKASVVTFNSQKVVCESFINPEGTKKLNFYFKTGKFIAVEEFTAQGTQARALIKSFTVGSDESLFSIPDSYSKLFFSSIEGLLD